MRFSICPFRRFSEQCSVAYHAGTRRKFPLAYWLGFWLLSLCLVLNSGPAYAEWVLVSVLDLSLIHI